MTISLIDKEPEIIGKIPCTQQLFSNKVTRSEDYLDILVIATYWQRLSG